MLNKNGIKKEIGNGIHVENAEENIGENYIFVTLGNQLKVYNTPVLDIKKPNDIKTIDIPESGLLLEPNQLYLGRTNEYTKTYGYVPLLSGLNELATLGIEIHITAGFGDNGFEGTWTLEIIVANPTIVYPNMPIGRIYYYPLIGDPSIEYHGKYLGQIEPTESKMNKEYLPNQTNQKKMNKQKRLVKRRDYVNK